MASIETKDRAYAPKEERAYRAAVFRRRSTSKIEEKDPMVTVGATHPNFPRVRQLVSTRISH